MLDWISRFWRTSVIGSFLAGLLFLLPIVLTVFIVAYIVNFVRGAIGPGTVLGDLLTWGGTYILGPSQDTLAFWLGVAIALAGIWLLGLIVKTRAKSIIQNYLDRLFSRVPLIRSIYSPVSRVVRMATNRSGAPGDLSSMSVVSCRFFGPGETAVDVLALLASQQLYLIAGERRRLVYLPAAPIPDVGRPCICRRHGYHPCPRHEGRRSFENLCFARRFGAGGYPKGRFQGAGSVDHRHIREAVCPPPLRFPKRRHV